MGGGKGLDPSLEVGERPGVAVRVEPIAVDAGVILREAEEPGLGVARLGEARRKGKARASGRLRLAFREIFSSTHLRDGCHRTDLDIAKAEVKETCWARRIQPHQRLIGSSVRLTESEKASRLSVVEEAEC